MSTVRHNLFSLYLELQRLHNRPFSWEEIARGTGMRGNQVAAILQQTQTERTSITNGTIAAFLLYFRSMGLNVDFNDIFIEKAYTNDDNPKPNAPNPAIDH